MILGAAITFIAIVVQSFGEVLYGTFLMAVSTPQFVLLGVCLTAFVFLAVVRFRMPAEGRGLLVGINVWTAVAFITAFFALKYVPPAVYASIEIGATLLATMAITSVQDRALPSASRVVAVAGIIAGCALLPFAETSAMPAGADPAMLWPAIVASFVSGAASAFSMVWSKRLGDLGWSASAVLGHRFYLTIAAAFVGLIVGGADVTLALDVNSVAAIVIIAGLALILPLLLFQLALRRADALTVAVCVAAQPMVSFVLALPSPAYAWSLITLTGVVVVTVFVGADIAIEQWTGREARSRKAGRSVAAIVRRVVHRVGHRIETAWQARHHAAAARLIRAGRA